MQNIVVYGDSSLSIHSFSRNPIISDVYVDNAWASASMPSGNW